MFPYTDSSFANACPTIWPQLSAQPGDLYNNGKLIINNSFGDINIHVLMKNLSQ